jgi:hypothetical protein
MNKLNSILLEGYVGSEVAGLGDRAYFVLDSNELHLRVWASAKLADQVQDRLKVGATVRVVGQLREEGEGVFIAADHIELVTRED